MVMKNLYPSINYRNLQITNTYTGLTHCHCMMKDLMVYIRTHFCFDLSHPTSWLDAKIPNSQYLSMNFFEPHSRHQSLIDCQYLAQILPRLTRTNCQRLGAFWCQLRYPQVVRTKPHGCCLLDLKDSCQTLRPSHLREVMRWKFHSDKQVLVALPSPRQLSAFLQHHILA